LLRGLNADRAPQLKRSVRCAEGFMQWSKLKSRIKLLMCPELQDVIDFHVTRYRKAHSWISESWITVHGQRVFDCGSRTYARESAHEFWSNEDCLEVQEGARKVEEVLKRREVHEPQYMGDGLRAYLDLSIDEALISENPFIKAFAIVDRRVGKRRLTKLQIEADEHSLVKEFYKLRRQSLHI
jgi:hypothetical protein